MIPGFRFKQFTISDAQCGMKLSSDAVLLGAYAEAPQMGHILDIGCGCGILALMIAQKSRDSHIDAIDVDEDACTATTFNIANSPWKHKIRVHHCSLVEFCTLSDMSYDCIISNPPYFHNQLKSGDDKISLAKHTADLNYDSLCSAVSLLLKEAGLFWVILPATAGSEFLYAALHNGLFCKKAVYISHTIESDAVRVIFCFSKDIIMKVETEHLIIKDKNMNYTSEYKSLTEDFYLDEGDFIESD